MLFICLTRYEISIHLQDLRMTIFSLADHYTVWTKSIIINILSELGDDDYQRSDSKEVLLDHLEGYFIPDVIEAAEVKALMQLAQAVSLLQKKRKYKKEPLVSMLIGFQNSMKEKAMVALQDTPEDTPEFTALARIIFTTDSDLHTQLETELKRD